MIQNHTLRVEPVTSDKQHEYWIHKQLPTSAQGMKYVHSKTDKFRLIHKFIVNTKEPKYSIISTSISLFNCTE
jgi:hypothetical protein